MASLTNVDDVGDVVERALRAAIVDGQLGALTQEDASAVARARTDREAEVVKEAVDAEVRGALAVLCASGAPSQASGVEGVDTAQVEAIPEAV